MWGWLKPLHQTCALCDNEKHEGMRGGRGKGMGGVGQGVGGEIYGGQRLGIISPIPFLSRSASGSKHIFGTQSHQAVEKRGRFRTHARADRHGHGEL